MSFLAALLALVIEQLRPLPGDNAVHRGIASAMRWVRRHWDAGDKRHAALVWTACVLLPVAATALVFVVLWRYSALLALAWNVGVLYLCLGFRQFSHHFTAIREALEQRDEARAATLLSQWQGRPLVGMSGDELRMQVMRQGLICAHRHVFGVFFCFVAFSALGLGPAGAVLYRLSEFMRRDRPDPDLLPPEASDDSGHLRAWSSAAFRRLDHVPARITAACFAMAGNFEEAVNRWRRDQGSWDDPNEGLILSAAAGAAGLVLTEQDLAESGAAAFNPATPAAPLQTLIGLVWRSLVLAMLMLALLSLANLLG